jgi:hypothetical protein
MQNPMSRPWIFDLIVAKPVRFQGFCSALEAGLLVQRRRCSPRV